MIIQMEFKTRTSVFTIVYDLYFQISTGYLNVENHRPQEKSGYDSGISCRENIPISVFTPASRDQHDQERKMATNKKGMSLS